VDTLSAVEVASATKALLAHGIGDHASYVTKGQAATPTGSVRRTTASASVFRAIFLDQFRAVMRADADGERESVMALWGMPGPPRFGGQLVTNIRNVSRMARQEAAGRLRRLFPATPSAPHSNCGPKPTPKRSGRERALSVTPCRRLAAEISPTRKRSGEIRNGPARCLQTLMSLDKSAAARNEIDYSWAGSRR
jgi:hypothetical protein